MRTPEEEPDAPPALPPAEPAGEAPPRRARRRLVLRSRRRDHVDSVNTSSRLLREQLWTLALLALLVLLLLVALTATARAPVQQWPAWGVRTLLGVFSFGALGATFSAARSLKGSSLRARAHAQVSDARVTLSRAVLGALPGLAAYAFLQSRVLNLGDADNSKAFAIAFIAGFSERLVLKVAETFAGEQKAR
ncbi:hypothetical protein WMF20_25840 [Sorangium sp. So ce834]|uniref:hypothetical protein n=1 Tax=Sorangium sp. So ce834 TaxID=3133321 RepID=UPI003F5FA53B